MQNTVVHGGAQDAVHPPLQEGLDVGIRGFGARGSGRIDDHQVVAAGTGGLVRAQDDASCTGRGGDVLTDQSK